MCVGGGGGLRFVLHSQVSDVTEMKRVVGALGLSGQRTLKIFTNTTYSTLGRNPFAIFSLMFRDHLISDAFVQIFFA